MRVDVHKNEPFSVEKELNTATKSVGLFRKEKKIMVHGLKTRAVHAR